MNAKLAAARAAQHAQLVRRVHAAKTWLKLDEETYRAAIAAMASGKTSSKACSIDELLGLLEHFHKRGFPRPQKHRPLTPPQKKMWALWQVLADAGEIRDRSMKGLLAWVASQTANKVQRLDWITPAQEQTLIESLKKWSERTGAAGVRA